MLSVIVPNNDKRIREGFNKRKATNLGFLPNFRGGGVRRGSYGPTPLTDIYFLLNTVLNALKHEISQKKISPL